MTRAKGIAPKKIASQKQSKEMPGKHRPRSPQLSPPPRLRRLGVRQVKDNAVSSVKQDGGDNPSEVTTSSSEHAKTIALLKKLSYESEVGVSPSNRQLKRLAEPKAKQPDNDPMQHLNPLGRTEGLKCLTCNKVFLSYHGYDMHLQTHDGLAVRCWKCNIRFRSNKSLLQHQRKRHQEQKQDVDPGFHDLIFVDFSSDSFPAISKNYCETNSIHSTSHIHDYSCNLCQKSFPISSALKLHNSQYHYLPSKYICQTCNTDYTSKSKLDKHKLAYLASGRKYLTDSKRLFIRSLSLIPLCMTESLESRKIPPERNLTYYEKLKEMETVMANVYESKQVESDDDTASNQS